MNVVFPIPFAPMMPMISPALMLPGATFSLKSPNVFAIFGHSIFMSGDVFGFSRRSDVKTNWVISEAHVLVG